MTNNRSRTPVPDMVTILSRAVAARTPNGAIRRISETGHVEYVISEESLKRAMHIEDHGFIFDVEFNSWDRELIVSMEPNGQERHTS